MKLLPTLGAAIAILIFGFFAGRQTAPTPPETESSENPNLSSRKSRQVIRVQQPNSADNATHVSPTDLDGLLDLVNPQMAFDTSSKLRAALGDLEPTALEKLLNELLERKESSASYYTLRSSLFNHLNAKDPFLALDILLAQDDQNFKSTHIALVIQAAAQINLAATREAIAQIDDASLKNAGNNALMLAPKDATPTELLALLKENPKGALVPHYGHHYGSWGSFIPNWEASVIGGSNGNALSQLAQKDLSAAEQYARGLETPNERKNALSQIASSLAQEDPLAALDWARGIEAKDGRDQHLSSVIQTIATKDPQMAASLLGEFDNLQFKNNSISNIANSWAQKDPQGALAWLDTMPANRSRMQAYQNVAYQLGATDPVTAIQLLQKTPARSRQHILPSILSQWASRDFDAAKNWITTQDDPILLKNSLPSFLSTWAQHNPAEAATFLDQSPTNPNRQNLYSSLAGNWANNDQAAALEWAQTIENESHRTSATQGVYNQWASQDPAAAAEQLSANTDPENRQNLLNTIARNWINQDPEAAWTWLDSLPAKERFNAGGSALSSMSYNQPEEASRLYDQLISEAANDENLLGQISRQASQIANSWGQNDPAAAATWAESITDESQQERAYQNIANQWGEYDAAGLAGWIDKLPTGKPRDSATSSLVRQIQDIDPASAYEWAETMSDDNQRYHSISSALDQWKQSDPEAAQQAAQAANVTDKQRERILNRLE